MNVIQARLVGMGLDLEIKTMSQGRKMQMTREPAMKTLGRLLHFDAYAEFGKGIKGRQLALEWLDENLVAMGEEPIKRLSREVSPIKESVN
jgi:hypothetical protein